VYVAVLSAAASCYIPCRHDIDM